MDINNVPDKNNQNDEKTLETNETAAEVINDNVADADVTSAPDYPRVVSDNAAKTELASPTQTVNKQSRFPKKKIFLTILALLAVAGIAGGAFTLGKRSSKTLNKSEPVVAKQTIISKQNEAVQHTQSTLKAEDITYLDSAKALGSLKLIDAYSSDISPYGDDSKYSDDTTQYYQIGTTKDGKDVLYIINSYGLGGGNEYLAISDKTSYTVFTKVFRDDNQGFKWAKNVTLDETTTILTPRAPQTAQFSGQNLKIRNFLVGQHLITPDYAPAENQKKDLGTSGGWQFSRTIGTDETSYQIISLQAKFHNLFGASYSLDGELAQNTDKALAIKWTQGDNNQTAYDNAGQGCGNSGFMIPKNVQKNQLTEVGVTPGGQKLYQLPSSHAFVQALYEKDYNMGQYLNDPTLKNLTIDQLNEKHGYILAENAFGDYVVMLRSDIFIRGGCAKPVIYLYPTQPTNVSVGVGAQVTLSEPLYPAGGWRNVLARPDGTLTYQGKQYGSLFWEGYGQGTYPAVTSGIVVPTAQALATIQQQLYQQGLNQKETAEFMDFWKTKLPNRPYTRLTWFGNNELQELAPLQIIPRPTTLIRVFLDSEGLDAPFNLPAQHFILPARIGFTAVEWGGLARDGSVPAL